MEYNNNYCFRADYYILYNISRLNSISIIFESITGMITALSTLKTPYKAYRKWCDGMNYSYLSEDIYVNLALT